jgi:hypothetical protein
MTTTTTLPTGRRSVWVSGDWLYRDDTFRYTVAYAAEVDDRERWNGIDCPHVTREVAEAIVVDQTAAFAAADDGEYHDALRWDGDVIVVTLGDEEVERVAADERGLYAVSFGWVWVALEDTDEDELVDRYVGELR